MWLSCLHCGQTYYGSGKFCTSQCEHDFTNPPAPKPKEIKKTCKFCGKKLKESQKSYCSEACKTEACGEHLTKLNCGNCNKVFFGYPKTKYCSDDCLVEARENRKKKNYVAGKCRVCGKPCPTAEAVCSWSCAVEHNAVR